MSEETDPQVHQSKAPGAMSFKASAKNPAGTEESNSVSLAFVFEALIYQDFYRQPAALDEGMEKQRDVLVLEVNALGVKLHQAKLAVRISRMGGS